MRDLNDHYDRAKERGVLEDTVAEVVADEYLDQQGVDPEEVADAEERATERATHGKNQREIVLDSVRDQENPGREDVREYARQFGMNPEKALRKLDKLRQRGTVGGGYEGPFRLY